MWQKIKQEFIKTFVRGDKIERSPYLITYRTHDPSRCEIWMQNHIKPWFRKNKCLFSIIIQAVSFIASIMGIWMFFGN